jgi:hypothetical protein
MLYRLKNKGFRFFGSPLLNGRDDRIYRIPKLITTSPFHHFFLRESCGAPAIKENCLIGRPFGQTVFIKLPVAVSQFPCFVAEEQKRECTFIVALVILCKIGAILKIFLKDGFLFPFEGSFLGMAGLRCGKAHP